ncbi:MAG: hypothetical protein U9N43_04875 [Euryarchaeota archaeon]|nr:hypothetical protein [Euryarchaeota archaeon]
MGETDAKRILTWVPVKDIACKLKDQLEEMYEMSFDLSYPRPKGSFYSIFCEKIGLMAPLMLPHLKKLIPPTPPEGQFLLDFL